MDRIKILNETLWREVAKGACAPKQNPPALLKPQQAFDNHPPRRHRSARGKPDGRRYSA
jgi:hypothetical protein